MYRSIGYLDKLEQAIPACTATNPTVSGTNASWHIGQVLLVIDTIADGFLGPGTVTHLGKSNRSEIHVFEND